LPYSPEKYADDEPVKEALRRYFSQYHFKDGGYGDKFFHIKLGFLSIPFPNTRDRIAAVKIHDLHHLATGYNADMNGDVEIGGWEYASGCGKYYMGWFLNSGSFIYGLLFRQASLYRAFMQGRRVRKNLCYDTTYDEQLLSCTVGDLRKRIGIIERKTNKLTDHLLFFSYSALILGAYFGGACLFCEFIVSTFS
jgi:hypothetical protein